MRTPKNLISPLVRPPSVAGIEEAVANAPAGSFMPLVKSLVERYVKQERDRRGWAIAVMDAWKSIAEHVRSSRKLPDGATRSMVYEASRAKWMKRAETEPDHPLAKFQACQSQQSALLQQIAALPGGLQLVGRWIVELSAADASKTPRAVVQRQLDALGVKPDLIVLDTQAEPGTPAVEGWRIGLEVPDRDLSGLLPELRSRLVEYLLDGRITLTLDFADLHIDLSDDEVGVKFAEKYEPVFDDDAPASASAPN